MAIRLGNSGVSSLLSSAKSAYERRQNYEDSIAAYEWDTSAKTQADYDKYVSRLNSRIKTLSSIDPSKALTLTKTATSAQRSYFGAEIGRASNDVKYGNISNVDKYNKIYGLYQQALAIGDENLASRLESQMASLDITIQNEYDRMQRASEAASAKALKGLKSAYQKDQPGARDAGGMPLDINKLGLNSIGQIIKQLRGDLQTNKISLEKYSSFVSDLYARQAGLLQAAAEDDRLDPDDQAKFQADLGALQDNSNFKKFASPGVRQALADGNLPFAIRVDEFGNKSIVDRRIAGQEQLRDESGKPLFNDYGDPVIRNIYNNYSTAQGGVVEFARKDPFGNTTSYQTSLRDVEPGVKGLKQGGAYYTDPVTGRRIFVKPNSGTADPNDVIRNVELPDGSNPFDEEKSGFARANDIVVGSIKDTYGGDFLRRAGKSVMSSIGSLPGAGVFGAIGSASRLVMGTGKARAEAEAKMAEERRQAEATRVRLAALRATPGPVAPNRPVVPVAAPSRAYLPTPVAKPAQVFSAVAGKNPSNASIAAGIGAAVGYNTINFGLDKRALDIINRSTSWGGAAWDLKQAGFNATNYDAQLKAKYAR